MYSPLKVFSFFFINYMVYKTMLYNFIAPEGN